MNNQSSSTFVDGLYVGGSGTWNVYNNEIALGNANSSGVNSVTGQTWNFANYNVWIDGIDDNLTSSSSTLNCSFNSVYIYGSQTGSNGNFSYAFRRRPSTVDVATVRDNIFINGRTGGTGSSHIAISTNSLTNWTGSSSDYNFLVAASSSTIGNYNGTLKTFANWQSAIAGQDAHSICAALSGSTSSFSGSPYPGSNTFNPANLFTTIGTADLHVSTADGRSFKFISNLGTPVGGITTDYDNVNRSSSTPTIGCFEVTSFPNDAGVTAVSTACPGTQTVTATIKNFGTATLNTVTVNWTVNGIAQTPASFSAVSLAPGASVVKNLGLFTFTGGTSYTIVATTSVPNGVTDQNTLNDSYIYTGYASMPATVYVGTGAGSPSYTTYSSLFNAINNSGLSQNLNVLVQNSTTEPSTPIFLNAPNICSGTDTIFITPVSATNFMASGTTNTSAIIGFNGASNVVIDGSFSGSGQYLHFNNANSSTTAGTLIFENSANHIVIKNCVIDLQSSASSTGPVISLSTSSSGSTGNSYITLSGDNIGDGSTYLSTSMIQSSGTSGTPNHDNSIVNNNIFNFGDPTRAYGINVTATGNGNNWKIMGNSLYNTAAVSSGAQTGINFIPGSSSSGDSISNNYLGGSAALCGNSGHGYWESSWNSGNTLNELDVVVVNAGTMAITGNTVQRILNSNNNYSGIMVFTVSGSTNATITGNYLGNSNAVQADEIVCNGGAKIPGTLPGYVEGIKSTSSGTVTIQNNTFYYLTQLGAHNGGYVTGIEYTGSGPISITNNYFAGLQSATNYTNYDVDINPLTAVTGIQVDSNTFAGPYVQQIGQVAAINVYGPSGTSGTVNKNTIYNLYNGSTGGNSLDVSIGITTTGAGAWTVSNNFITMENYSLLTSSYYTNAVGLYGILDNMSGGSLTCDYNTVYIGGSQTGSSNSNWYSYAFARQITSSGDALSLKNNIFMNSRSGAGNHYAIGTNPTTGWTSSTSDYNFLSSANTSTLGQWGSTDETFAGWQSAASAEAHSTHAQTTTGSSSSTLINPNELFTAEHSANMEILLTYPLAYAYASANATPIVGITTDINGTSRSTTNPDMGADEFITCISSGVTTQPGNQTVCAANNATFTMAASGAATITYQWQESTNGGGSWSNISNGGIYSGATSVSLTLTGVTSGMNAYQYQCIATNSCGNATTNPATLTVNSAPAITVYSPVSFENDVCSGSNTSFGVTATGTGLTYQWQVSTDNGSTWNAVTNNAIYSGATTSSLSISTNASLDHYQYKVVVSGSCTPAVTSSAGLLKVGSVNITAQPSSTTNICDGANGSISVTATGTNLGYQWQLSTDNGGTWNPVSNGGVYSGATTSALGLTGVTVGMNNYKYRCIISTIACSPVTSSASTLTVTAIPAITTTTPGSNCVTGTVTLGANSSAGTINWFANATGGLSLGTGTSFTTPSISSTTNYYVDATASGCTTASRTTVTATINAIPSITGTTPGSHCGTGTVVLGASASAGTINWYANATGGSSLNTGISFTTPTISATTNYYVDATATGCTTASRTTVTATITAAPVVTAVLDNCSCNNISNQAQNIVAVYATGGVGNFTFTALTSGDVLQTTVAGDGTAFTGSHAGVKGVFWSKADGTIHQYKATDGVCTVTVSRYTQNGAPIDIAFASSTQSPAGLPGQGGGNGISGSFNNSGANSPGIPTAFINGPALTCHQTADFGNAWVTYIANNLDVNGNPNANDSTNNKAVLEINNYGQNLDSVAVSVYREPYLPSVPNRTDANSVCYNFPEYAMERHFVIQSNKSTGANSFASNVGVRLYFSDAELQDMIYWTNYAAAANANTVNKYCTLAQVVNNTGQLYVTKYTGNNEDGDYTNNSAAGIYRMFGPNTTLSGNGPSTFDGTGGVFGNNLTANRHYVEFNVREFSEFWMAGSGDIMPLPVEMIYFEAEAVNNEYIQLGWATDIEVNNKEFQVERSTDGTNWTHIGTVEGHGNSTTKITYTYDDMNVVPNVSYYFRLKQVDFNFDYKYIGIVSAEITGNSSFSVSLSPNPTYGTTSLIINTSKDQPVSIDVYDVIGQKMASTNSQLSPGYNKVQLELGNLASGTYNVSITSANEVYIRKLVVTK